MKKNVLLLMIKWSDKNITKCIEELIKLGITYANIKFIVSNAVNNNYLFIEQAPDGRIIIHQYERLDYVNLPNADKYSEVKIDDEDSKVKTNKVKYPNNKEESSVLVKSMLESLGNRSEKALSDYKNMIDALGKLPKLVKHRDALNYLDLQNLDESEKVEYYYNLYHIEEFVDETGLVRIPKNSVRINDIIILVENEPEYFNFYTLEAATAFVNIFNADVLLALHYM